MPGQCRSIETETRSSRYWLGRFAGSRMGLFVALNIACVWYLIRPSFRKFAVEFIDERDNQRAERAREKNAQAMRAFAAKQVLKEENGLRSERLSPKPLHRIDAMTSPAQPSPCMSCSPPGQAAFGPRLHSAIDLAARVHEPQHRKEPDRCTPYVAHSFGVAMLLSLYGFDEDVVIAGLLHDVLEDQPQCAAELDAFGSRVSELVGWVTERKRDETGQKLPWAERKQAYVERMRSAPPEARAISAADTIHNMQSSLLVLQRGQDPWSRMGGSRELQLKRHETLLTGLRNGWIHPILDHYRDILEQLGAR